MDVESIRSGQPIIEEKATPPQEKEALIEEIQEANKAGENDVLAPPQVNVPFRQKIERQE